MFITKIHNPHTHTAFAVAFLSLTFHSKIKEPKCGHIHLHTIYHIPVIICYLPSFLLLTLCLLCHTIKVTACLLIQHSVALIVDSTHTHTPTPPHTHTQTHMHTHTACQPTQVVLIFLHLRCPWRSATPSYLSPWQGQSDRYSPDSAVACQAHSAPLRNHL